MWGSSSGTVFAADPLICKKYCGINRGGAAARMPCLSRHGKTFPDLTGKIRFHHPCCNAYHILKCRCM